MNGVIVIDKPQGFTSFDVIAVVRRLTRQRKTGHTGTLDPNATGVLPVLLGSATKAQDLIVNHDKTYVADFRLGLTTDTLDIWVSGERSKPRAKAMSKKTPSSACCRGSRAKSSRFRRCFPPCKKTACGSMTSRARAWRLSATRAG